MQNHHPNFFIINYGNYLMPYQSMFLVFEDNKRTTMCHNRAANNFICSFLG